MMACAVSVALDDEYMKMLNLSHDSLNNILPFMMGKIKQVSFGLLSKQDLKIAVVGSRGNSASLTRRLEQIPTNRRDEDSVASGVYTARSRPPSCQVCCVYIRAYYRTVLVCIVFIRNGSMYCWLIVSSANRVLHICCCTLYCMLRMAFLFRDKITKESKIVEYLLFGWF